MNNFEIERLNLVIQIIEQNEWLTYNTKENLFNNHSKIDTTDLNQLNHLCNTYNVLQRSEDEFLRNKSQTILNQIEQMVSQL